MTTTIRITQQKGGSNRLGPCEICHQSADTVHLFTEFQVYRRANGSTGQSYSRSLFGHKHCLDSQTVGSA